MKNAEYYVWLVKCMGVGNPRSHKILEIYDNIAEFYSDCKAKVVKRGISLTPTELSFLYETDTEDIAYVFKEYKKFFTQYITIEDELYPQQLKNIDNPPLILFVVGDITHLEEELLLTVVGTRKESLYGRRACELICSELCVSGFSIVSGLANGGDTTAHLTALKCGARTYGFLACGLDIDYPYGKASLKNSIYKHGAIITEFLPGTKAFPQNFHIRNRLMSGLSVGTLVVECPKRSGTSITANAALNQGRDVFAVPHGIFWKNGAGITELIQNGAKPVKDALDIIEEYIDVYPEKLNISNKKVSLNRFIEINRKLGLGDENSSQAIDDGEFKQARKTAVNELKNAGKDMVKNGMSLKEYSAVPNKDSKTIEQKLKDTNLENNSDALKLIDILDENGLSADEIAEKTNLTASKIMVLMTKLELAGIVDKLPGNRIKLVSDLQK